MDRTDLAQAFGFTDYEALVAGSLDLSPHSGDENWFVTPIGVGRWVAWDTAELPAITRPYPLVSLQFGASFATEAQAIQHQIDGAEEEYRLFHGLDGQTDVEVTRNYGTGPDGSERIIGWILSAPGCPDERYGVWS